MLASFAYFYPAALLSVWTVLAFLYLRLATLHSTLPVLVDVHPMACFLNPKADILDQRPGGLALGLSLVACVVPVVNLLFCAFVAVATVMALRQRAGRGRSYPPAGFDLGD